MDIAVAARKIDEVDRKIIELNQMSAAPRCAGDRPVEAQHGRCRFMSPTAKA